MESSINLPKPSPETKANQLTTYFSELFLEISKKKQHPLHPIFMELKNRLFDLADILDAQLEHPQLPSKDLAQATIINQWLALTFLESLSLNNSSTSPETKIKPTHQLFPFLLALANLEDFQESTAAVHLRQLISGAYAHARLLHTFQQLQKQQPNRFTIYIPEQPPETLDIVELSDKESSALEIVQWELAGIDFAFYDESTKTLYLIDAKGDQKIEFPTVKERQLGNQAKKVAQSITSENSPPKTIKHLEIKLPIPPLRQSQSTLEPLPKEQQTTIINNINKI